MPKKSLHTSSLVAEIKKVILFAQENAVRSIDQHSVLMYWQIGKQILKRSKKEKIELIMVLI